jgi:hypothetical protein
MSVTNTLLQSYITLSFSPVAALYTTLTCLVYLCAESITKTVEMDKVVQIKRQIFAIEFLPLTCTFFPSKVVLFSSCLSVCLHVTARLALDILP